MSWTPADSKTDAETEEEEEVVVEEKMRRKGNSLKEKKNGNRAEPTLRNKVRDL